MTSPSSSNSVSSLGTTPITGAGAQQPLQSSSVPSSTNTNRVNDVSLASIHRSEATPSSTLLPGRKLKPISRDQLVAKSREHIVKKCKEAREGLKTKKKSKLDDVRQKRREKKEELREKEEGSKFLGMLKVDSKALMTLGLVAAISGFAGLMLIGVIFPPSLFFGALCATMMAGGALMAGWYGGKVIGGEDQAEQTELSKLTKELEELKKKKEELENFCDKLAPVMEEDEEKFKKQLEESKIEVNTTNFTTDEDWNALYDYFLKIADRTKKREERENLQKGQDIEEGQKLGELKQELEAAKTELEKFEEDAKNAGLSDDEREGVIKLRGYREKVGKLKQEVQEESKKMRESIASAVDALDGEIDGLHGRLNALGAFKPLETLEMERAHRKRELERLNAELGQLESAIMRRGIEGEDIGALEAEKTAKEGEIAEIQQRLQEIEK